MDEENALSATGQDNVPVVRQDPWPSVWTTSQQTSNNANQVAALFSTEHGMYASIPILCKGASCPYGRVCRIQVQNRVVGDRCPIEIAAIMGRFDKYLKAFNIDPYDERYLVDMGMVKDLVDIEVMMLRADNRMAISADFIDEVVAAVSPDGTPYYKNELSKSVELKEKLRHDRQKIIDAMNASRKNKEATLKNMKDASTAAADLMARARLLTQQGLFKDIVDAEIVDKTEGEE